MSSGEGRSGRRGSGGRRPDLVEARAAVHGPVVPRRERNDRLATARAADRGVELARSVDERARLAAARQLGQRCGSFWRPLLAKNACSPDENRNSSEQSRQKSVRSWYTLVPRPHQGFPVDRSDGDGIKRAAGVGMRARLRPCPDGRNSDAEDTRRVKGREDGGIAQTGGCGAPRHRTEAGTGSPALPSCRHVQTASCPARPAVHHPARRLRRRRRLARSERRTHCQSGPDRRPRRRRSTTRPARPTSSSGWPPAGASSPPARCSPRSRSSASTATARSSGATRPSPTSSRPRPTGSASALPFQTAKLNEARSRRCSPTRSARAGSGRHARTTRPAVSPTRRRRRSRSAPVASRRW